MTDILKIEIIENRDKVFRGVIRNLMKGGGT